MEEPKKSSNWTILISILAVLPFFWDLLKWFTESVFDWFWTGILSLVTIFYIFGLAKTLRSKSKQDELILKNSKEVVGNAIDECLANIERIVQHSSSLKDDRTKKTSNLSEFERIMVCYSESTIDVRATFCSHVGVKEMSILFRTSNAIRSSFSTQVKLHAELNKFTLKIKDIKKLEAIFPVWKTYNQHVDKIRLAPSNVMQERLEKLIKETKHNYLPESQEISSKDPFHRIIEMLIDKVFDEYFSPLQIEGVTQTLEKTLNDVVGSKIPGTSIKITNFTSGASYPHATSIRMLETGQIQVSIEWIPVGAEISLNIDFMVLSAISHLTLKIPLQILGLNLKANVWFPTKPPYDVHISLVEMPQLIYPIDIKFGLLPLPNPMAFEGVKETIKSKLQEATWARFVQPGVFVLPFNFTTSLGYDKIQDEINRIIHANLLTSEHKVLKNFLTRYSQLALNVRNIGARDNNDLPNRDAIVIECALVALDIIDWVTNLKNPKTSFVGNAAFKSYSYCIKALEPEEVFKFIADDDVIASLTDYCNEEPQNVHHKDAQEIARILTHLSETIPQESSDQLDTKPKTTTVKKIKLRKPSQQIITTTTTTNTTSASSTTSTMSTTTPSSTIKSSGPTSGTTSTRRQPVTPSSKPLSTTTSSSGASLEKARKQTSNTLPQTPSPSKSTTDLTSTSTILKLSTDYDICLIHGSLLVQNKKIKNANKESWYITFPPSYQGIYIGPLTKSLNLKTGCITIKNLSKDVDLIISSFRLHGDNIDVVMKGQYILEPYKTKQFLFCKEWIISISHTLIQVSQFTDQIDGKYESENDLLLMATKY